MWIGYRALEFGVELNTHEERMGCDFNNLRQTGFGVGAGDSHARFFYLLFVFVVEFIAVTVSLANQAFAIGFVGF